MYERILMPTDGSYCSETAIRQGLQLAKSLGSRVTFVFVLESPLVTYQAPQALAYIPQLYEDLREAGREALRRAAQMATEAGVDAETRLVEERDPVNVIQALQADHDLVVMGTHGRRGMNRWVFGSVAEGALRRSERPFLMVRCKEDRAAEETGQEVGQEARAEADSTA